MTTYKTELYTLHTQVCTGVQQYSEAIMMCWRPYQEPIKEGSMQVRYPKSKHGRPCYDVLKIVADIAKTWQHYLHFEISPQGDVITTHERLVCTRTVALKLSNQ